MLFRSAGNVYLNGSTLVIGNTATNVTINSTSISVSGAQLNGTNFAGTANNATNFGGHAAAYYTNATNITTGTLPYAQIPANIVNTTAAFTISGVYTHTANLVVNTGIVAGGSRGTAGQVLTSNGSSGNVYWSTVAGGGFNPYYGISTTSIRIGCGAGTSSSPYQGIAIGYCAGHHCQGCDTVALGPFAGASYQGNYSVDRKSTRLNSSH
mgnify:FL=1